MFSHGTDTAVRWPRTRWDEDLYYSEDYNAAQMGKTYSVHGAFLEHNEVEMFDADIFGISHGEALFMAPEQRLVLETGYMTLLHGGYTRKSLRGARIGTFWGDVGSEELLEVSQNKHE